MHISNLKKCIGSWYSQYLVNLFVSKVNSIMKYGETQCFHFYIMSHIHLFTGQYTSGTFHKFIKDLYIQYGDIVKHRVGLKQWKIFLFNPDDIRESLWQDEKYPHRDQSTIMTAYARRQNTSLGLAFQYVYLIYSFSTISKYIFTKVNICPDAVICITILIKLRFMP